MQLHPTLGNATHLSYKSRLMKHKPAAFITKPRKLKAAYFRVTSNMTACSGFLTLQTQRNLVNLCRTQLTRPHPQNSPHLEIIFFPNLTRPRSVTILMNTHNVFIKVHLCTDPPVTFSPSLNHAHNYLCT